MLVAHNNYRALHCAPLLTLNDTLCQSAQSYANHLADIDTLVHSNTANLGENLYMMGSSESVETVEGAEATDAWYKENKDYNFQTAHFSSATGHFTQVVWKGTKTFGVGFAITADGHSVYVVAQYSPPGNYLGKFPQNVFSKQKC